MKFGEASDGGGDADGGGAGVRGGGVGAAMIHRGTDRYAGGHLVIQKAADLFAQEWGDEVVGCVVCAGFCGVDGAGEVPFEETEDGLEFVLRVDGDGEGGVAEELGLQVVWRGGGL